MSRVGSAFLVALSLALCLGAQPVHSYYDDTHYALTYYAARVCGYTPMQAHRAASANLSVDYSELTEPVQNFGVSSGAQQPRVDFHAFRDSRPLVSNKQAADAAIALQEQRLWEQARALRNPGVLLHFSQDVVSHAGYSSIAGHWVNTSRIPLVSSPIAPVPLPIVGSIESGLRSEVYLSEPHLPHGGTTDWLSYRTDQVDRMLDSTINQLRRFLLNFSPRQRPAPCSRNDLKQLVVQLIKANAVPPTDEQFQMQIAKFLSETKLATFLNRKFEQERGIPEVGLAHGATRLALRGRGELPAYPYPDQHVRYTFDASGTPTAAARALDDFTLVGDLKVRLESAGSPARDVKVSVWTVPHRAGELPYQLMCRRAQTTEIQFGPIGEPNVTLDRLPVGDVMLYAVDNDGNTVKQKVTLDSLEQRALLSLPADSQTAQQCGRELAQVAEAMCATSSPGAEIEKRFQARAAAAEACQATRMTENAAAAPVSTASAPKPKGGGTSAWTYVAIAAGATSGIVEYLSKKQDEESSSTPRTTTTASTPTTTPTTTTPPPTTTPPSQGARCSTRNCIVSALSGNCDCTGSVNAACPTTSIQRTVGGACFSNGMYCDINMSCNNNRCERNSTEGGRCRFP